MGTRTLGMLKQELETLEEQERQLVAKVADWEEEQRLLNAIAVKTENVKRLGEQVTVIETAKAMEVANEK